MNAEDREWIESVYVGVIGDDRVRAVVWQMAESMREEGDPELSPADLVAAQQYLRRCLMRKSQQEIAAMLTVDFAGLWSRGMLGSARYRAQHAVGKGERGGRGRRSR